MITTFAGIPWISAFSLWILLIAMVLVAVALGLIVDSRQVSTRCGPKFVAVSHLLHARYIRVAVRIGKTIEYCHTCRSITRIPKLNRRVTSALAI